MKHSRSNGLVFVKRLSTNPQRQDVYKLHTDADTTEIKFGLVHREKWNLHKARISCTFYLRDKLRVLRALWWNGVVKLEEGMTVGRQRETTPRIGPRVVA